MDNLMTKHKGYLIDYNEGAERFRAFVDGNVAFENTSLRDLKIVIDKFEKAQSNKYFKRFKILIFTRRAENYVEAEVTSITEDGDYWILDGKTLSKQSSVILATESNIQKINKMMSIKNLQLELHREHDGIEESLDRLKNGTTL